MNSQKKKKKRKPCHQLFQLWRIKSEKTRHPGILLLFIKDSSCLSNFDWSKHFCKHFWFNKCKSDFFPKIFWLSLFLRTFRNRNRFALLSVFVTCEWLFLAWLNSALGWVIWIIPSEEIAHWFVAAVSYTDLFYSYMGCLSWRLKHLIGQEYRQKEP